MNFWWQETITDTIVNSLGMEHCWNHFTWHLLTLSKKAVAPRSSPLAWKSPWTEEPGGLQSMGSLRVGHDWATSLSHFTFMHWRRKWQPMPVFLPGESQGWGSRVGCRLWGHRVRHDWSDLAAAAAAAYPLCTFWLSGATNQTVGKWRFSCV